VQTAEGDGGLYPLHRGHLALMSWHKFLEIAKLSTTQLIYYFLFIEAVLLQSLIACKLCLIRPGVSLGVRLGVSPVSPRLSGNASIVVLVVTCAKTCASIPRAANASSATTPKV
jgi:hypothetical protein